MGNKIDKKIKVEQCCEPKTKKKDVSFKELFDLAKTQVLMKNVTPFIYIGTVGCAILTKSGKIFTGLNIKSKCSGLGMCAERNISAQMLAHGENEIDKVACMDKYGRVCLPCGTCREMLMQMSKNNAEAKILTDIQGEKFLLLKDLLPNWWGVERYEEDYQHQTRIRKTIK